MKYPFVCNPDILDGEPCYPGTRIGESTFINYWEADVPAEKMAKDYPSLGEDVIRHVFRYLDQPFRYEGDRDGAGVTITDLVRQKLRDGRTINDFDAVQLLKYADEMADRVAVMADRIEELCKQIDNA